MLVSIIVPVYKQEKTIFNDLKNIWEATNNTRWDFEIIAVVDGYVDKSFETASKFKKENMKIVGYEDNRGKGYAIRYGAARANGDYIAFLDAGMDINPNGISMILEHMEWYKADIIVASKRHAASRINNYPFFRRVYSFGYHVIIKLLFGIRVGDTQSGLKVFRRQVVEKVFPRLLVKAFALDVEILAVSSHLGFKRIYEAPVEINWEDVGIKTNFSSNTFLFLNKHIRRMFIDTLAVFYRLYILRYYDDSNKRKWVYDANLQMRINTGESS